MRSMLKCRLKQKERDLADRRLEVKKEAKEMSWTGEWWEEPKRFVKRVDRLKVVMVA